MDKTRGVYIDFIPEGEEEGSAYGVGGYRDFVPAREPKVIELEPIVEIPAPEEVIEKKGKK